MKKEINVLSIDWDYFMAASSDERGYLFPDGGAEEIPEYVQLIVWSGRYLEDRLAKIGVEDKAIKKLVGILKNCTHADTQYMIADSHKHMYEFVISARESRRQKLNLVNIDFHHDLFGTGNGNVHCGNWLLHLMREFPSESKYKWVARKDSLMEGVKNLEVVYEDMKGLEKVKWDMVFICRSGMWSPPHLDNEFKKAFSWIAKDKPTRLQQDIFESRYNREFRGNVEQQRQVRERLSNEMKENR